MFLSILCQSERREHQRRDTMRGEWESREDTLERLSHEENYFRFYGFIFRKSDLKMGFPHVN